MSGSSPEARRPGRPWGAVALVAVATAVIAVDQATKTWALHHLSAVAPRHIVGPLNLVLTFNRGAAFSLGSGIGPVVEVLAVALVVGALWASGRLARRGLNWPTALALGLIMGGSLSNLADRLVRHHHGGVIDFVQVVSWWPVFNVADSAISVGAVILALSMALRPLAPAPKAPEQQPQASEPVANGEP